MNVPLMKSNFTLIPYVWYLLSKKPMATHQASINIQEPTEFKLKATRTRIEYSFHLELDKLLKPSIIRKPSSTNSSKNSPSNRNLNQSLQQSNPKTTDLNHGRFCNSDDKLCNRWCGNLRPEGNIRPNPLVFFSLPSFWNWNSETWHHTHTSEFLNFRCQTSFCRIPSTQNLSVLAHKPMKTP